MRSPKDLVDIALIEAYLNDQRYGCDVAAAAQKLEAMRAAVESSVVGWVVW